MEQNLSEQNLSEIRSKYNLYAKKQQLYDESERRLTQNNSKGPLRFLADLFLLAYVVKYILKYMRYCETIEDYHKKYNFFDYYVGSALRYLAPHYSKIFDFNSDLFSFMKNMAIESLAVIFNSKSTAQILKDGFLVNVKKPEVAARIFENIFKIQLENPYNVYIGLAIFLCHIFVFRHAFSIKIFIIIIFDFLCFLIRVLMISLGGLGGLMNEFSAFKVMGGMFGGCFWGCLVTILIHRKVINRFCGDVTQDDIREDCLEEAKKILYIRRSCNEKELEMMTFNRLQINDMENKKDPLIHNNWELIILASYEIVLEKMEGKKRS